MHIVLIRNRNCRYGADDVVSAIATDDEELTFRVVEQTWLRLPSDATLDALYEALAAAGHTFDVCNWAQVEHAYLSGV